MKDLMLKSWMLTWRLWICVFGVVFIPTFIWTWFAIMIYGPRHAVYPYHGNPLLDTVWGLFWGYWAVMLAILWLQRKQRQQFFPQGRAVNPLQDMWG